ncbi:glycosyltransferase family 2 protein [Spirosoma sp. RP8]|uniref:Glycosyltransferase family 2 protein n=1 Tax=Spirosoma liriopis TaxID=2937440 RepID=A0ABT0HFL9_9BACT|nr:glycosyltransferase family 2 protein [Spirosoma liriopis]MCK8490959.1 glycosyltransferase family 2 protein [Spirosoma liriopis]
METVAAVVVTFNRLTDLKRCIGSLRKQSYPLSSIIVFDNGSTDGTADWLSEQTDVCTIINKVNLGGAGGFHHALKYGYEKKSDWFWIMDDDCCPEEKCLEKLLAIPDKEKYAGLAPTVYEDGKVPVSHRANLTYSPNLATIQSPLEYGVSEEAISEIDYASFVGLLLPYRSVSAIGLPRPEFFIHYDDVEYSLRLKRKVGKIALLHSARIDHYQAAKPSVTTYPIDKLWIRFYGIRNSVWLKREPWSDLKPIHKARLTGSFIKTLSAQLLNVILHDDHKVKRIKFYTAAYLDGWFGVFDNEKPRVILGQK